MGSEFRIKTVANLTTPTTVPPEETCRYGICFSFQVSPDTAGLFCGVRGSRGYDFELGTDVILFREFADISAERAIAVSRNHEAVNPRSSPPGQPAIMVKYPIRAGLSRWEPDSKTGRPVRVRGAGSASACRLPGLRISARSIPRPRSISMSRGGRSWNHLYRLGIAT